MTYAVISLSVLGVAPSLNWAVDPVLWSVHSHSFRVSAVL